MSTKKKKDSQKSAPKVVAEVVQNKHLIEKAGEINTPNTPKDFFANLGKNAIYVFIAMLILVTLFIYKDFIFLIKSFYFKDIGSDSYNSTYPYLYHVSDYMAHFGLPKWSFGMGMGQNLLPFMLGDPFNFLMMLLGKQHIHSLTIYKELLKIFLSGIIFFKYLKTLQFSDYTAIIGSLLFSFCSYTVVGGCWDVFSYESFLFAFLLLAFEQLFLNNKWVLFPIAIIFISISQPFNLYVYGLFLFIYSIFRFTQQNKPNIKEYFVLIGRMVGLGVIALLISAPFLTEIIVQMLESPRGSGTNSYTKILSSAPVFDFPLQDVFGTSMLRFFSSDIIGTGNDYKGWQNFLEAPMLYCGLFTLVLMPQVFAFLSTKKRIIFGVFITLWLLPLIFPYFRYAFWLFTGDYFRAYAFMVSFVMLYFALVALDFIIQERKINIIVLIGTLILLFTLLNYPYFVDNIINPAISVFVSIFIIFYAVIIFLLGRQKNNVYLKYVIIALVIIELIYLSGKSINDREAVQASELAEKTGYNDYTVEALKYIKQHDPSFYRIDKTYSSSPAMHYSLNDAMAQGYFGTSEYNSFNQVYYIYYLQLMGISDKKDELQSRWAVGMSSRPILESENRVKYFLAKAKVNPLWNLIADSLATFGDVKVYRSKFILPVGFTYRRFMKESNFNKLSIIQKDFVSLKTAVIRDEDISNYTGLSEFELKDTFAANAFNFDLYKNEVNELGEDSLQLSKFTETDLVGSITTKDNRLVYITIPYDGGWHLIVDGKPTPKLIVFAGMTGVMLPKGTHTITMHYELRYFYQGVIVTLIGLLIYGTIIYIRSKGKTNKNNNLVTT